MRPCDKEDMAQEKLLAELEGRAFNFSAFRAKHAPPQEISAEDPEAAARGPLRFHNLVAFQTAGAGERDERLKAKAAEWCAAGASLRWIARELSRLRVPKFGPRKVGKPWTRVGVLHMLRRMGLQTQSGKGWGKMAGGALAASWVHWTKRPGAKEKLTKMSAAGHAAKARRATTASGARRGPRRCG